MKHSSILPYRHPRYAGEKEHISLTGLGCARPKAEKFPGAAADHQRVSDAPLCAYAWGPGHRELYFFTELLPTKIYFRK